MASTATAVTPMMAQYIEIKARYQNALLFYRMGDFYELFFDDAVVASEALSIALTKRGKHDGDDIPMCGVPHHSAESYLLSLIKAGFRVAICEQLESPQEAKKRGSKSVVKRDVVRLVTPGTLAEDSLLAPKSHNFLASLHLEQGELHMIWCDISTSECFASSFAPVLLGSELLRIGPAEVILSPASAKLLAPDLKELGAPFVTSSGLAGDKEALFQSFFGNALQGENPLSPGQSEALTHLLIYLQETLKDNTPQIHVPQVVSTERAMLIDAATRRNLEINTSISGDPAHGLLRSLDLCKTAAGARLLSYRLNAPHRDLAEIYRRLDLVSDFAKDHTRRKELRTHISGLADISRALSRLSMGYGGPRDLKALQKALESARALENYAPGPLQTRLTGCLTDLSDLAAALNAALDEEPPLLARDGGFIRSGYDAELDHFRDLQKNGRGALAALQAKYIALTNISSLKVKHNNVLGYFIETPATHAQKMQSPSFGDVFIHRQTTANQIRFTTDELAKLQSDLLEADHAALVREQDHFEGLRTLVLSQSAEFSTLSAVLAELDLSAALAQVAVDRQWCRPELNDSKEFTILHGRHPVVESALQKLDGSNFVGNDCNLSEKALMLITGPNMAGKSTYLRQNALIVLLGQMGSYVPAKAARFGVVSSLFSRVGASDDLAQGQSTFMVEMTETAAILNRADERSFVILDEIGRGTSTYDGLSIAWAVFEYLHKFNKSRALFATHYHEMTTLAEELENAQNATVRVSTQEGKIRFLYEIIKGISGKSYGIHVARLAGLPASVLDRATMILRDLESGQMAGQSAPLNGFDKTGQEPLVHHHTALEKALEGVSPDELSPKEALEVLYMLKQIAT